TTDTLRFFDITDMTMGKSHIFVTKKRLNPGSFGPKKDGVSSAKFSSPLLGHIRQLREFARFPSRRTSVQLQ
ncbi:hypothetical protein SK128_022637, partial [Halocaridina rubra]